MKMYDTGWKGGGTKSAHAANLQIVERRFRFLGFNDVDTLRLDKSLGQMCRLPCERERRKRRPKQRARNRRHLRRGRLRPLVQAGIVKRDTVNNQASLNRYLTLRWRAMPAMRNDMHDVPCVREQGCHPLYIG